MEPDNTQALRGDEKIDRQIERESTEDALLEGPNTTATRVLEEDAETAKTPEEPELSGDFPQEDDIEVPGLGEDADHNERNPEAPIVRRITKDLQGDQYIETYELHSRHLPGTSTVSAFAPDEALNQIVDDVTGYYESITIEVSKTGSGYEIEAIYGPDTAVEVEDAVSEIGADLIDLHIPDDLTTAISEDRY